LYKDLSDDQCKMIKDVNFDGLLQIACPILLADFANWLFVDCFDAGRYINSLELGSLQVPTTKPWIAAWDRKHMDEVIKMDTDNDGSFGKLKLKPSAHTIFHSLLFHMDDIKQFVKDTLRNHRTEEEKICAAVSKVLRGVTEWMETFV
ncbi:hypothetical protein BAE44_0008928, partial [Dichanthelium oligosanthes]